MSQYGWPPGWNPSFDNCDQVSFLCPVEATTYGAYFNLAACVIFTVIFALLFIYQIGLMIWGRTWSFSTFLLIGTAFELMGYGARISMTPIGTVWNYPAFVIQLLFLILGPTLVAAAISVTFKWIVIEYGTQHSVLKPRLYPYVFVGTDFFSIIIQAVGGAVSATATGGEDTNFALLDAGSGLLVAGTAFQAANMIFCGGLMVLYWYRRERALKQGRVAPITDRTPGENLNFNNGVGPDYFILRWSRRLPGADIDKFIFVSIVAYVLIIIRCIYRIPEMAMGWGSTLMQNETLFLVLDGTMIALSVILLTIFHPALFFPVLRKVKKSKKSKNIDSEKAGQPPLDTANSPGGSREVVSESSLAGDSTPIPSNQTHEPPQKALQ